MKKKILCAIMALLIILAVWRPISVYAQSNSIYFTVEQMFASSTTAPSDIFTYRLTAAEADHPLPPGSTAAGFIFTIAGNRSIEIGPLTFTKQGTYLYTLSQIIGAGKPHYSYDTHIYTLELRVVGELEIILTIRDDSGEKVDEIVFENHYSDPGTDPEQPGGGTTPPPPIIITINPPAPTATTTVLARTDPEAARGVTTTLARGPQTGDETDYLFIISMFMLGAILTIVAIVALFSGGRRKERT